MTALGHGTALRAPPYESTPSRALPRGVDSRSREIYPHAIYCGTVMGAALRRVRAAVTGSPRWLLVRGVLGTNPPLAALAAVLVLLTSLVPTGASLATGLLVGSLTPAVAGGAGSPAGQRVALAVALLGGLFVLQQLLGPLSQAATDAL